MKVRPRFLYQIQDGQRSRHWTGRLAHHSQEQRTIILVVLTKVGDALYTQRHYEGIIIIIIINTTYVVVGTKAAAEAAAVGQLMPFELLIPVGVVVRGRDERSNISGDSIASDTQIGDSTFPGRNIELQF